MSDPITNVEIEDVLASIRRLVSAGDPTQRRGAQPHVSQGERLVLTPALRVAEPPKEKPASEFITPWGRVSAPGQMPSPDAAETPETPAAVQQEAPEAGSDSPTTPEGSEDNAALTLSRVVVSETIPPEAPEAASEPDQPLAEAAPEPVSEDLSAEAEAWQEDPQAPSAVDTAEPLSTETAEAADAWDDAVEPDEALAPEAPAAEASHEAPQAVEPDHAAAPEALTSDDDLIAPHHDEALTGEVDGQDEWLDTADETGDDTPQARADQDTDDHLEAGNAAALASVAQALARGTSADPAPDTAAAPRWQRNDENCPANEWPAESSSMPLERIASKASSSAMPASSFSTSAWTSSGSGKRRNSSVTSRAKLDSVSRWRPGSSLPAIPLRSTNRSKAAADTQNHGGTGTPCRDILARFMALPPPRSAKVASASLAVNT